MMQQAVISAYFETFGKGPLRKISAHTGIQTSRVFRILNGSEMKIGEFERFQNLIANQNKSDLGSLIIKSESILTATMKKDVCQYVERLISKRQIQVG